MTWMEKFKKEHPTLADAYIMDEFCPDDGLVSNCPTFDGEVDCRKCWHREIPGTGELTEEGPDRT